MLKREERNAGQQNDPSWAPRRWARSGPVLFVCHLFPRQEEARSLPPGSHLPPPSPAPLPALSLSYPATLHPYPARLLRPSSLTSFGRKPPSCAPSVSTFLLFPADPPTAAVRPAPLTQLLPSLLPRPSLGSTPFPIAPPPSRESHPSCPAPPSPPALPLQPCPLSPGPVPRGPDPGPGKHLLILF